MLVPCFRRLVCKCWCWVFARNTIGILWLCGLTPRHHFSFSVHSILCLFIWRTSMILPEGKWFLVMNENIWNLRFLHWTFLIAVQEGVFYFLNSSLFWLMHFWRELPSIAPFAELMDDFRVSKPESNCPAWFRMSLCWEKSSFCSPREGYHLVIPKHSMSASFLCLWSGKEQIGKTIWQERGGLLMSLPLFWSHVSASLLISLILAWFGEKKKGNKLDFWKMPLVPGIGSILPGRDAPGKLSVRALWIWSIFRADLTWENFARICTCKICLSWGFSTELEVHQKEKLAKREREGSNRLDTGNPSPML